MTGQSKWAAFAFDRDEFKRIFLLCICNIICTIILRATHFDCLLLVLGNHISCFATHFNAPISVTQQQFIILHVTTGKK